MMREQTSLIAARRAHVHRRLGVVVGVLAVLMLVVGYLTAVEAARLGVTPPGGRPPLVFLSVPLGTLVVFGGLPDLGRRTAGCTLPSSGTACS